MNRRTSCLLPLALFLAIACSQATESEQGKPGPPAETGELSFEPVSEGSGEANQEPLARLPSGQLLLAPQGSRPYRVVAGLVRFGGRELTEIWYGNRLATWEALEDEGLVRYGDSERGLYAKAMLLVPATVRVGKAWQSAGYRFEVLEREVRPTAWGEFPVWRIQQLLSDSDSGCDRYFAEGFGIVRDQCDGGHAEYATGLEWLEAVAIPTPDPVGLTPVTTGGVPVSVPVLANHVSAIDIAPGERPMVATVDQFASIAESENYALDGRACLDVRVGGDIFERRPVPVEGLEKLAELLPAVVRGPATCPYGEFRKNDWRNLFDRHPVAAGMLAGGEGGVWYGLAAADGSLYRGGPGLPVPQVVQLAAADFGGTQPVGVGWSSYAGSVGFGSGLLTGLGGGNSGPQMSIAAMRAVDGWLTLGLVMDSGLLFNTRVDSTGLFEPIVPGPWLGPWHTVRASPEQRDAVLASPGGTIDRLLLTGQGWTRKPLANVALPAGEDAVAGAFVREDSAGESELLVLTRASVDVVLPRADGTSQEVALPRTRFWTAKIPTSSPGRPWLGALGVTAEMLGSDLRVCWPPAGEPETEGWVLGGAPVLSAIPHYPDYHCIALFRSPEAPRTAADLLGNVAEGPVPGVGRVRITMPVGSGDSAESFSGGPALKGGGFISRPTTEPHLVVYGAGAIPLYPLELGDPYAKGYEDIGGNGLWNTRQGESGVELVLANGAGIATMAEGTLPVRIAGGGGIVIDAYPETGYILLRPDGSHQALPSGPLIPLDYWTVLADGTACGHRPSALRVDQALYRCVDPDGTVRETEWTVDPYGLPHALPGEWSTANGCKSEWPLPSGHIVISDATNSVTWLVDPAGPDFSELTPGLLQMAVFDSSGRLYGSLDGVWYEVTSDGLLKLDLGGTDPGTNQVWVDENYYIVGNTRIARHPTE